MPNQTRPHGGNQPNRRMLRRALFLLIVCGIVAFGVLIAKLYQIQITQHDLYESEAITQQVRSTTVDSGRGTIYDRNGKILAMSATVDTIYISPIEIIMYDEDPVFIAQNLSEILDVDYGEILERTGETDSWYQVVARRVEQDVADQVREFKNEYDLKGVKIETDSKRYYLYSTLASHVIGFVGYENTGLAGIELQLDDELTGTAGRVVRAKNAYGTDMLYTKFEDYYDAEDGCDVTLTIDTTIQYYMEKHLQQAVDDYGVQDGAAAIAMDVNTGEILGMVSLGNFDLNDYQAVSEETQAEIDAAETEEEKSALLTAAQQAQWHNNAVEDMYEPGSTFKPITMAMALQEGVVTADSTFYCGGVWKVAGDTDEGRHCWLLTGHGMQTLTQCLQHSCNVALMQIAQLVGAEKFYEYVDAFGLNEKTGIELSGEAGSLWWDSELFCNPYNQTQLAAASFGQTFNITPLQLIRAMCAVVNGGYLMQPYLVKQVTDSEGNTVLQKEPTVIRQVISEETSEIMRGILEQVVSDSTEGTGKNAYVSGYRIGGKTGTSTDTVTEAATGAKKYIVLFIGFAPADDPEICILVLLKNPSSDTGVAVSGGNMGAPTVANMMADILPYLGVEAVYSEDEAENMDHSVPNLVGLSLEEAEQTLIAQGFTSRVIGSGGSITAQLPAANAVVAAGSQILLYADSEIPEAQEEVPDLTGLTYEIARERMGWVALYINTDYANAANIQNAIITQQSIEAGTFVDYGTVIKVTLSNTDASTNAIA
ncbi:MAG: PASTA domain-containing protein [Oscillospiraceae bacterium]|nr:PASTA domain-containing protein [Oscillospiraceae bacterium]